MDDQRRFVTEETDYVPPYPRPRRKLNKKYFLFALIVILTILILAAAGYYLSLNKKSATADNAPRSIPTIDVSQYDSIEPTRSIISATPSGSKKISVSPSTTSKSRILTPIKDLEGFRTSAGSGNITAEIRAGKNNKYVTRGFVSFDLSPLPIGADIVQAELRLYLIKNVGEPESNSDGYMLDHLTYGNSLDDTDYAIPALLSGFTKLVDDRYTRWMSADVSEQVRNDLANARSMAQFRIRFNNENLGNSDDGDFVYFESIENLAKTDNLPQLVIKYN